ncbi:alcohol dehydrogenase, partial [Vibrio parahaemolyticus]|nr:alcohol dehydrogenase [Vibrio parahaemolyticus]
PTLSEYGVCSTSFEQVARDAMKSNAIKGNPIPLTSERLIYILNQVCACRGECVDADIEAHRHGAVLLIHDSAEEESSKLRG